MSSSGREQRHVLGRIELHLRERRLEFGEAFLRRKLRAPET